MVLILFNYKKKLSAPEKCAILWSDIRKKDLTTGGTPSIKMMEEIFEKNRDSVKLIFRKSLKIFNIMCKDSRIFEN